MTRATILAAILLLAACAKSEEASLVPPQEEDGYNLVQPVVTPLGQEGEFAVGEWARSMQDEQPMLAFGPPATEPLFSLRCGDDDAILVQRHGVIAGPGLNVMQVEAGGGPRRLPVTAVEGPLPLLRGSAPEDSPLVGELGSTPERITVRIGNGEPLVMPASTVVGEFLRSCSGASAETASADEEAEAGNEARAAGNEATPSERTQR